MPTVRLDFETRSVVDLRAQGVYIYAAHPTTDINCLAWAVDDGPVRLVTFGNGVYSEVRFGEFEYPRDTLFDHACNHSTQFRAFNANFERVIWREIMVKRYGFPAVPDERWHCTMAEARAMGLPGNLEDCAVVLKVREQKDAQAWRVVGSLSRPRKMNADGTPVWWTPADAPEKFQRLYDYCRQDVRAEREIEKAVRRLSPSERRVYLLDQKINDRGVQIDVPLVRALQEMVERGLEMANDEIRAVSAGGVRDVNDVAGIKTFLNSEGVTHEGAEIDSVRKSVTRELLEGELPGASRRLIELRAEAGRSSVAKLNTTLAMIDSFGIARGLLMYNGANTGRWAGRGIQPQNFTKSQIERIDEFVPNVLRREWEFLDMCAPPLVLATWMMRGTIRARDGHVMRAGDFSGIEARIVNWVAGQDDVLAMWAAGGKVYESVAAAIYGRSVAEIKKPSVERDVGKATELGCGFGMGWKTFMKNAREKDGIFLEPELSQKAVRAYRDTHQMVKLFWQKVEECAVKAIETPGAWFEYRGCRFTKRGAYLWLVLPSGRVLAYAKPCFRERTFTVEEEDGSERKYTKLCVRYEGLHPQTKKWGVRWLYGGLLTENIVQALARDLLAEAMLRLDARGHEVVLTVHDEVVCDDPAAHRSLAEFHATMAESPAWAAGLPIAVETWEGERYRK